MNSNRIYDREFFDWIYGVITEDEGTEKMLSSIAEDYENFKDKNLVHKCMYSVLAYERKKNSKCETNNYGYKAKCVIAMLRYLEGYYSDMDEAAYAVCNDAKINKFAGALESGALTDSTDLFYFAVIIICSFALSLYAGLLLPLIFGIGNMAVAKPVSCFHGHAKAIRQYKKIIAAEKEKEPRSDSCDSPNEWDCYYPTYVNM